MARQQKARYFGEECNALAAFGVAGYPVVQVLQQDSATLNKLVGEGINWRSKLRVTKSESMKG